MRQGSAYVCPSCSVRRCEGCNTVLNKSNAATQFCSPCIAQQRWQASYDRLLEALKMNNGVVPHVTDDPKRPELLQSVANWCKEQRKQYSSKTLSAQRCQLLEQISSWSWKADGREDAWRAKFAAWQKYYAQHGRHPPRSEEDLGRWLNNVQQNIKSEGFQQLPKWQQTLINSDSNLKSRVNG